MKGRLNLFQATMLRWRELHPYNAVHVVRIDGPLDAARLRADHRAASSRHSGLTGLALDAPRARYEYAGGARAHVALRLRRRRSRSSRDHRAPRSSASSTRRSPRDGRLDPFRFFAVDAGASFHLGLTYDHFIAGGDSIVVLLKAHRRPPLR